MRIISDTFPAGPMCGRAGPSTLPLVAGQALSLERAWINYINNKTDAY